jgi:hypothetical protein
MRHVINRERRSTPKDLHDEREGNVSQRRELLDVRERLDAAHRSRGAARLLALVLGDEADDRRSSSSADSLVVRRWSRAGFSLACLS